MLKDGPNEEGVFAYQGVPYIFPPTLWGLLNYLWRKRSRRAFLEDAIEDLWGGDVSRGAVESAVCRINKIFKAEGIPLGAHTNSPYVFLRAEQA